MNNQPNTNPPPPPPPSTVTATLSKIVDGLTSMSLESKDRKTLSNRANRCPDELIALVCQLAEQNGGAVLGMAYDVAAAKDTLAYVKDVRTQLNVARQLVQRLEDEALQKRAEVADPTFAVYTALRRLTKTKQGNALKPAFEQMALAVKNRPRRTRSKGAPKGKAAQSPSGTSSSATAHGAHAPAAAQQAPSTPPHTASTPAPSHDGAPATA